MSRADKGHSLAIVKKEEYIKKMEEFISTSESTILKSDPTPKYQTDVFDEGLKTRNMYRDFIKTQNLIKNIFFEFFLFICETPQQFFLSK